LTNADIAERLALEGEAATGPLQKAFRRAARAAFLWPEEAAAVAVAGRSLTELPGIGPYMEKKILAWFDEGGAPIEPPELRRGFFTMARARALLYSQPAWRAGLRGDLQMHTTWSDGSGSVLDMAEAAEERGYEYIAITDHAKGLKIAGGIDEAELAQQGKEIDSVNRGLAAAGRKVRVLRSLEMNLNPRGEGDMSASSVARLDLVLGCFHSALRKTDDQTSRYLAALRNPSIQILGHPKGRIFNYRPGLSANWAEVFAAAAELGKAVEIDAYPDRQDLSGDLVRMAAKAGCHISLGTDSHHRWQLGFIDLGLASACDAGIKRSKILNFMSKEKLLEWVSRVRS
jgi:histidinol phosphatase-like PHP family hydrolase